MDADGGRTVLVGGGSSNASFWDRKEGYRRILGDAALGPDLRIELGVAVRRNNVASKVIEYLKRLNWVEILEREGLRHISMPPAEPSEGSFVIRRTVFS